MKRSDMTAFLKKMNDRFAAELGGIPARIRPKKKSMEDMKAGFADGARMTILQLIDDGILTLEEDRTPGEEAADKLSKDALVEAAREGAELGTDDEH